MSDECEREESAAEDAYFVGRDPELDKRENRMLFRHAFERGWDRREESKLVPRS